MQCFDSGVIIGSIIWAVPMIMIISWIEKQAGRSTGLIKDVTPPLLLSLFIAIVYAIIKYKYFTEVPHDATFIEKMPIFQVLANAHCALDDIFSAASTMLSFAALWRYFRVYKRYVKGQW